jgi:hypothetical protein
VSSRSVAVGYQRFGGPEDGGNLVLRNVGTSRNTKRPHNPEDLDFFNRRENLKSLSHRFVSCAEVIKLCFSCAEGIV